MNDITGQPFGQLVCEGYAGRGERYGRNVHLWHFRCACGTSFTDVAKEIVRGNKNSCGCIKAAAQKALGKWCERLPDISGQEFGRLTVREKAGTTANRQRLWLCDCVCGGTKLSTKYNLEKGRVWSCGCAETERNMAALEKAVEANRAKYAAMNSPILRGLISKPYVRPRAPSVVHRCED